MSESETMESKASSLPRWQIAVGGALLFVSGVWLGTRIAVKNAAITAPAGVVAAATAPSPKAAPIPAPLGAGRLSSDQAELLAQELAQETGKDKKVWLSAAADREAEELRDSLAATFGKVGWKVIRRPAPAVRLKPGVFFFIADDGEPASYVQRAATALEAAGLKPMQALGYRAFYQAKKKADPNWVGVELAPDQSYAIVVGPKPWTPSPAPQEGGSP